MNIENFKNIATFHHKVRRPKSRTAVSLALLFYMILVLMFSGLGDGFNQWSPWSPTPIQGFGFAGLVPETSNATLFNFFDTYRNASIRFAMTFISICMISVFGFFTAKETSNLIFANSKKALYSMFLTIFVGYLFTSLFYTIPLYFYNSSDLIFVNNSNADFSHLDQTNQLSFKANFQALRDTSRDINADFQFGIIHVYDGESFATFGLWLSIIILIFLTVALDVGLLWYYHLFQKKYVLSLFAIHFLFMFAIFAITYTSIIRGWSSLLLLALIAIGTDSFAYIFGKRFGKHKMIPHISPNKTWGGAIYGVLTTAVIIIFIIALYGINSYPGIYESKNFTEARNYPQLYDKHNMITNVFVITFIFGGTTFQTYWWLATIMIVVASCIICIMGDLLFSYIKRCHKIKDFGNSLGSHGGILDRFDSTALLFSVFMIYIIIMVLVSGRPIFNPNFYVSTVG